MSEPPNKKQKGQDGSGDDHRFDDLETYLEKQVAHTVGKPIVKTTTKPADPSWSRANVTVDDTAHYIPPGFMETAQGYDEYIHLAADLSSHQYEWVEGTTGVTEIGGYVREEFDWVAGQENLDFALWVNEDTKHAFVVYKGTTEGKEWITQNFDTFRGNEGNNPYFSEAYQAYTQCVDNLGPEYTVDVTGHSLGGSKAMYVTRRAEEAVANGVYSKAPHSITFNPGTGPWTKLPSRENNLIIRNAGDPIRSLPEEVANTVTYKNYDTLDAVFNFEHRANQHGIDAFISNAASNDGGSFVDAAVESGLPDRPRPGYDLPVRDGDPIGGGDPGGVGGGDVVSVDYGDVIEVGGDIGGIGDIGDIGEGLGVGDVIGGADVAGVAGRAAEEAAAKGLAALQAEIMESVVMSEFDMLMMFDMTGQGMSGGGGLGDYIADSVAWDASGYGDVKDLNHYTSSMYDKSFGKAFEPKATAEKARRGVIKQVHDFYQHPLQYNEHLFKDRADYKQYQTDFILNSLPGALKGSVDLPDGAKPLPNWAMSFNRVLKGYAKEVARDEEYMKTKSNYDWYSGTGKFSSGFLGTSLSVQDMGLLLAQQAQIVQQTLGYQDDYHRRTADLFDQDGMKAVLSAVARQEYIDKANSQQWYNNDKPAIPSYNDAYDTMVKRRKEDYIKDHPELQKIIDDYEQNGIIPHSFGPDFKYPEQSFGNDTPPDWWRPPDGDDPAGGGDKKDPPNWYDHPYGGMPGGPVAPNPDNEPSESDKNSASNNNNGMTGSGDEKRPEREKPHNLGDDLNAFNLTRNPGETEEEFRTRKYFEQKADYLAPQEYDQWERFKRDHPASYPDYPRPALPGGLNPANGGQGHPDTSAPSVPPRNEHDLHPGQPGYVPGAGGDGLPDGERHDPHETHPGVTHDEHDHEEYMNHDVNNHMQAPSEGMSTSQYTQALSRFTNNAFGNLGTMKSKGMNFTRFVELSDVNGSMAEHARDMLAD
jgi:hypothetical protein